MEKSKYCILFSLFILSGCFFKNNEARKGLINWEDMNHELKQKELFKDMQNKKLNVLYQYGNFDSVTTMNALHSKANDASIDIYYLLGESKYALKSNINELLSKLNSLITMNDESKHKDVVKGIMLDVEPYLLNEWKQHSEKIMDSYVDNMKLVYRFVKKHELKLILCIPYYYDQIGYKRQLVTLSKVASDGFAIMNYYRKNEAKHIDYEVSLCEKYDKQCINIYEFKKPGDHDLKSMNTYYSLGFKAANNNFVKLQNNLNEDLELCFHDYKALKEVWRNE